MDTDPEYPIDDGGGRSIDEDAIVPPDSSWSELFDGIWRRMTNPLPPPQDS